MRSNSRTISVAVTADIAPSALPHTEPRDNSQAFEFEERPRIAEQTRDVGNYLFLERVRRGFPVAKHYQSCFNFGPSLGTRLVELKKGNHGLQPVVKRWHPQHEVLHRVCRRVLFSGFGAFA